MSRALTQFHHGAATDEKTNIELSELQLLCALRKRIAAIN